METRGRRKGRAEGVALDGRKWIRKLSMSRALSDQSTEIDGKEMKSKDGRERSLTDTSETGMVDQTGITVLNGFPCPNLVDSRSGGGCEEVVKSWFPYLGFWLFNRTGLQRR